MPSYYKVNLKVNGFKTSIDIVAENPTFEKYERRILKALNPKSKDKVEFISFELIKEKLGL